MEKERKGASFPVREMTFYMDGGEEVTKVRRKRKYVFYEWVDERSNDAWIWTRPCFPNGRLSWLDSPASAWTNHDTYSQHDQVHYEWKRSWFPQTIEYSRLDWSRVSHSYRSSRKAAMYFSFLTFASMACSWILSWIKELRNKLVIGWEREQLLLASLVALEWLNWAMVLM